MKPVLLLGTEAFSPFRMYALKKAMGRLVPGLERADLRARWVYAVESEDGVGVPPESLMRAAALLNSQTGDGLGETAQPAGGFGCPAPTAANYQLPT